MSSILPPNQWPNLDPLTYVIGFIKDIAEKLDGIKEDISGIKSDMAVIKATTVTKEVCSKNHEGCLAHNYAENVAHPKSEDDNKSFWLKELSASQITAWCLGFAAILGVLIGSARVIELLR